MQHDRKVHVSIVDGVEDSGFLQSFENVWTLATSICNEKRRKNWHLLTPFLYLRNVKIYRTRHAYIIVAYLTMWKGLQSEGENTFYEKQCVLKELNGWSLCNGNLQLFPGNDRSNDSRNL